jgi:hypothetical protein
VATVQALKVQADNCCVLLADRLAFSRLALIPEAVFFSNEAHEATKILRKDAKTQRKEGARSWQGVLSGGCRTERTPVVVCQAKLRRSR